MARSEHGFTLVEMLVVLVIMASLLAIAVGFNAAARDRASDASARSNIEVAMPAIAAYGADNGGFAGMTVPGLQSTYSPGVQHVSILSADATSYCVTSSVNGRAWYKLGPAGGITTTACT
jgi:prepilin-type N-terminal cleavage/methylation domain-containing protein